MKKYLPVVFGIILIISSFVSFSTSVLASLLLLLSGLILTPAYNILTTKFTILSFLGNKYIKYLLVLALFLPASGIMSSFREIELRNKFNKESTQIFKEISNHQENKEFFKAGVVISNYLKVLPQNEELINLKKINDAIIEKETAERMAIEAKKRAEDAARREADAAATYKSSTPSDGSQPGYMYVLVDSLTARNEATFSSYGACSAAKASKPTTNWQCIGRPKFTNEK